MFLMQKKRQNVNADIQLKYLPSIDKSSLRIKKENTLSLKITYMAFGTNKKTEPKFIV